LLAADAPQDRAAKKASDDQRIRTIYVPVFQNHSYRRGLEFDLTQAVIREIEAQTPYKVVADRDSADSELLGTIATVTKNLLNMNQEHEDREMVVTVLVAWRDLRTGEVLLRPRPLVPAHALYRQGEYEKAQALFRDVADNAMSSPALAEEARFYEAESLQRLGKYRRACATYHKMLEDFPSGVYRALACKGMFAIANFWLEDTRAAMAKAEAPEAGQEKPVTDQECRALEALERAYFNDPTGPLADKALFLAGSVRFFREDYQQADHYFTQLTELHPDGPLRDKAIELAIIAKHLDSGDIKCDGRQGVEALQLINKVLRGYPRPDLSSETGTPGLLPTPPHVTIQDKIHYVSEYSGPGTIVDGVNRLATQIVALMEKPHAVYIPVFQNQALKRDLTEAVIREFKNSAPYKIIADLVAAGTAYDQATETNRELARLQGKWVAVSSTQDPLPAGGSESHGEEIVADDLFQITFNENDLVVKKKDINREGIYSMDATRNPKTLDVALEGAPKVMRWIYELNNDELTVGWGMENWDSRPTNFSEAHIITFRRVRSPSASTEVFATKASNDEHTCSVYVPVFKTKGVQHGLERDLRMAVVREIETNTPCKVIADRDQADSELLGTIETGNKGGEAQKLIVVQLAWRDLRTGKSLLASSTVNVFEYAEVPEFTTLPDQLHRLAVQIVSVMEKPW